MDTALVEIFTFVKMIPPFDLLPETVLQSVVTEINICYVRRGQQLPPKGVNEPRLYLIRSGALSLQSENGQLLGKYGEGDSCAIFCFKSDEQKNKVQSEEDALLYSISFEKLIVIVKDFPDVAAFFQQSASERLNTKMSRTHEDALVASSLMNSNISNFFHTPVATIDAQTSIEKTAQKMTELGFSCLVIMQNNQHVGIVTDKDIRSRCVAAGISSHESVSKIMTTKVSTIDIKNNAYQALIMMISKRIHHLPVADHGAVIGMLTITDLMNNEGINAINMTSIIRKASSVDELAEISKFLPKLQARLTKLGTTADHVAKNISAITMAFTIRLIEMAEKKFGPAPVPYAWLAAGSQARQEQLAHSDQDNALIISDELKPEHDAWFHDFATYVSDGLAACGFIYCPGNVMATNPKWRKSQSTWNHYFEDWVNTPEPKALMHCSIFFDLETIYGDTALLETIRAKMLAKTKKSTLFIAHLTHNALNLRPPLGFFRDFVLIQNGKNKAMLDLKHNGIAPIVDLARIYALSEGISVVNTIERLKLAAGTASLSKSASANLIDALELLGMLRLEHQAKQLEAGQKPDNYLSPKEISRLEREHMKDAFKVIKTMQDNRPSI